MRSAVNTQQFEFPVLALKKGRKIEGALSAGPVPKTERKMATSSEILAKLNLKANPEGGFYSETFRDHSILISKSHLPPQYKVDRPISTAIYFFLPSGSISHLHRIPSAETWHFYLGDPITVLELNEEDRSVKLTYLGQNILQENQLLQYTTPPYVWFCAFPTLDFNISAEISVEKNPPRDADKHFSLVGCTVAPGFQFEDFELAKRSELISLFPAYEALITLVTFAE